MISDDEIVIAAAGVGAFLGASSPVAQQAVQGGREQVASNLKSVVFRQMEFLDARVTQAEKTVSLLADPFELTEFAGILADYREVNDRNDSCRLWCKVHNSTSQRARMITERVKLTACGSVFTTKWVQFFDFNPGETRWIKVFDVDNKQLFPGKDVVKDYLKSSGNGETNGRVVSGVLFLQYYSAVNLDTDLTTYSYNTESLHDKTLEGNVLCRANIKSSDSGLQILKEEDVIRE